MAQSKNHKGGKHRSKKRKGVKKSTAPVLEITGRVDSLGVNGDGKFLHNLKSIYVPLSVPGDEGEFTAQSGKGKIKLLHKESPMRRAPICEHFGACGGCKLQHVDQAYYVAWKADCVRAVMAREGFGDVPILPLKSSALNSRRRAGFALRHDAQGIALGFRAQGSHDIIPLTECHILHPDIFVELENIKALAAQMLARGTEAHFFITLAENGLDIDVSGDVDVSAFSFDQYDGILNMMKEYKFIRLTINKEPFYQKDTPFVVFGKTKVELPPRAFLQATLSGQLILQDLVCDAVEDASYVADLFAGCGTFSFVLAEKTKVYAVENDVLATRSLKNAANNFMPHNTVTGHDRDLFFKPLMPEELNQFDAVVFDPPRAGAKEQCIQIAKSEVEKIVGVSCDVKTFARDAAILRSGGYQLQSVQPVDQFLFSTHTEVVGVFRRP